MRGAGGTRSHAHGAAAAASRLQLGCPLNRWLHARTPAAAVFAPSNNAFQAAVLGGDVTKEQLQVGGLG